MCLKSRRLLIAIFLTLTAFDFCINPGQSWAQMATATTTPTVTPSPSVTLNGTTISQQQVAAMAQSLSPTQINAIASILGVSSDQLQTLKQAAANGTLSQS